MRVAWVHTNARTILVTGEDLAAEEQALALERAGVDVRRVAASVHERAAELHATAVLIGGRNRSYADAIVATEPDVIHVHKWYPWLGRRDLSRLDRPVVATLHNYRPLCPVGTLFRDGGTCTECVGRAPVPAVRHGCYDGSRIRTVPLALSRPYPAARHPLFSAVSMFVAPSRRAADVLTGLARVPPERVRVVPSFVDDLGVGPSRPPRGWLFVGQLEPTKGIEQLVRRWPRGEQLTVVGTGSLERDLTRWADGTGVRLVGRRGRREVRQLMADSLGLLFPSTYLETQGLVVGEAASVGCPVVALQGTAGGDQVAEHGFGVVMESLEELDAALATVASDRDAFSAAATGYWCGELGGERWVARMRSVYAEVTADGVRPID